MFTLSRPTARLLVIVPFAAFFAAACEHNIPGPPPPPPVNPPPGTLLAITVTPTPVTLPPSGPQQFAAAGSDINGAAVAITPLPVVWSVVNGGGTINGSSGLFTAGTTLGTYNSTVKACNSAIPNICGFATVIVANPPPVVNLGTASTYGILAGSAVTCVTGGTIKADVGISPGSAITGFPSPCTLTGTLHAADAPAAQAQVDLTTAYNALVAFTCGTTVTPADLGGRTLAPGVYCASTSLAVTGTVTLDGQGNANAFWVFQMGSTLTTGTTANVALINGAQAKNVYWQVGSSATLGTSTTFRGNILALTSITLNDNATMLGRALARNGAVTIGTGNTITLP